MKLIIESYICLFWILALSDLDTLTYNHISLCDLVLLYYKRITLIQLNLPLKIKRLATLKKKKKKRFLTWAYRIAGWWHLRSLVHYLNLADCQRDINYYLDKRCNLAFLYPFFGPQTCKSISSPDSCNVISCTSFIDTDESSDPSHNLRVRQVTLNVKRMIDIFASLRIQNVHFMQM